MDRSVLEKREELFGRNTQVAGDGFDEFRMQGFPFVIGNGDAHAVAISEDLVTA